MKETTVALAWIRCHRCAVSMALLEILNPSLFAAVEAY